MLSGFGWFRLASVGFELLRLVSWCPCFSMYHSKLSSFLKIYQSKSPACFLKLISPLNTFLANIFILYPLKPPETKSHTKKEMLIPTGTLRRIHVDSTWILRRYVEDQISMNFHVISAYFFDVTSMVEKSTWFPRTFFEVISMVKKSTWFPRIFSM